MGFSQDNTFGRHNITALKEDRHNNIYL